MTVAEAAPEPRREKFKEAKLPDEPQSDAKLTTEGGMVLRERVTRIEGSGAVSLQLSYSRLDEDGSVMSNAAGPMIFRAHEITIPGENASRLGESGIKSAVAAGREVGAARAVEHFKGLEMMGNLMASRLA